MFNDKTKSKLLVYLSYAMPLFVLTGLSLNLYVAERALALLEACSESEGDVSFEGQVEALKPYHMTLAVLTSVGVLLEAAVQNVWKTQLAIKINEKYHKHFSEGDLENPTPVNPFKLKLRQKDRDALSLKSAHSNYHTSNGFQAFLWLLAAANILMTASFEYNIFNKEADASEEMASVFVMTIAQLIATGFSIYATSQHKAIVAANESALEWSRIKALELSDSTKGELIEVLMPGDPDEERVLRVNRRLAVYENFKEYVEVAQAAVKNDDDGIAQGVNSLSKFKALLALIRGMMSHPIVSDRRPTLEHVVVEVKRWRDCLPDWLLSWMSGHQVAPAETLYSDTRDVTTTPPPVNNDDNALSPTPSVASGDSGQGNSIDGSPTTSTPSSSLSTEVSFFSRTTVLAQPRRIQVRPAETSLSEVPSSSESSSSLFPSGANERGDAGYGSMTPPPADGEGNGQAGVASPLMTA